MKERLGEFWDEFPEALNPELYRTHINFEEEERLIKEEERIQKKEQKRIRKAKIIV